MILVWFKDLKFAPELFDKCGEFQIHHTSKHYEFIGAKFMNRLGYLFGALVCAALPLCSASAETMTPASIVTLSKSGLGDEAIIAKIKSEGAGFALTTDEMLSLRRQGVSSAVIAAMLSNKSAAMSMDSPDPMVAHPAGVYLFEDTDGTPRMRRIDPTSSNQAKTGGLIGSALTAGIASASIKVSIQRESAPTRANSRPRFYFFFDQNENASAANTWASGANTMVTSPSEFTLIKLKRKDGRREARVGSANIAGSKVGVMDKDRIAFEQRLIRPGVYQVEVMQILQPGEYGFIFALGGAGAGGAMTARIFDFNVP